MHINIILEATHQNSKLNLKVGGIANQVLQLLKSYELINNLNISLITKYSEYQQNKKKIKIYQIHKFHNYILDTFYFYIKTFFKIIKIHKLNPIHVLNIHDYSPFLLIPYIIKLIFKIPILIKIPIDFSTHISDTLLQEKNRFRKKLINFSWLKFFQIFLLKKIDFIRVINSKIYDDILRLKYPKKRIFRISNGISSENLIGIKKLPRENTQYGYVGRIVEFKNIKILLRGFIKYLSVYPKDKLFFYGKGSYERKIKIFIQNNNLGKNIYLCGFKSDKRKIFSNIDVLIDPALGQGMSNSNLEAMASNTFVIASKVYGNTDLITGKINGLLFKPDDETDLLKQLYFYKENKNLVSNMINNAKNKILFKYDINIIARKIYSSLLMQLNL